MTSTPKELRTKLIKQLQDLNVTLYEIAHQGIRIEIHHEQLGEFGLNAFIESYYLTKMYKVENIE